MIKLSLSETEIDDIVEALDDPETSAKVRRKLLALRLHSEGVQNQVIAKIVGVDQDTVTNYIKGYRDGGLSEVMEDRAYKPSSSVAPFFSCLTCIFTARPPATAKEGMHVIEKITGIKLSVDQARRIMKKLGLKFRKTGQIPAKADPQQQFDFMNEKLLPRIGDASKGNRKVFYVDAVHFVLGCFMGMIWCFSRIFVKGSTGRQRYNILGAVCSHTKEVITVRSKANVNSLTVIELLEKIRNAHPSIAISLILDNASYQHNKLVKERADELDIELLFLPPYSPNLNLIERLWKMVKKECLSNRYFPTFADFQKALDDFMDRINSDYQNELERIISNKFQLFRSA